jgi:ABC-type glycerol-3-phosphate transport system substrate-binding protein
MSLFKKDSMNNNNHKTPEKSIHIAKRIDIFIIIVILIVIISPIVINLVLKTEARVKQVNLFLSMDCEELLGKEATKMLLQEFNEQNPDIRIRLQPEGGLPDIFIFDERDFNVFVAAGMLADLSSYELDIRKSEDNEALRLAVSQFASQLAIPLVSFMDMLFYNIEILSAAGFDHPPKTREEYITYTRSVSRGNFPGILGAALSLSSEDRLSLSRDIFSWTWAAGGNFWPEVNNLPQASPETMPIINTRTRINDITFLGNLNREVQTQRIFERTIFETTGDQSIEEFAQGRIAMMIASTRVIPYLRERMGDEVFGITTIPVSGAEARYSISLSSIYAGINSDSLYPDAAWRFLEFLAEKSAMLCAELKAVPGLILSPIPGDYVRDDPFYSKAWDIFEASRIIQGFSGRPDAQRYEAIFLEELQNFFEGSRTAQQAVISIQRRWNEVN